MLLGVHFQDLYLFKIPKTQIVKELLTKQSLLDDRLRRGGWVAPREHILRLVCDLRSRSKEDSILKYDPFIA